MISLRMTINPMVCTLMCDFISNPSTLYTFRWNTDKNKYPNRQKDGRIYGMLNQLFLMNNKNIVNIVCVLTVTKRCCSKKVLHLKIYTKSTLLCFKLFYLLCDKLYIIFLHNLFTNITQNYKWQHFLFSPASCIYCVRVSCISEFGKHTAPSIINMCI